MKKLIIGIFSLLNLIRPLAVFAHDGQPHTVGEAVTENSMLWIESLINGILRPFLHPTHLLALLAVGVIAAGLGGKAIGKILLLAMVMTLVGFSLASGGVSPPFIEESVIGALLFLGAIILLIKYTKTPVILIVIALFAFFHGAAFGAFSSFSQPFAFASGLVIIDFLLCVCGITLGKLLRQGRRTLLPYVY